MAGDQQKGGKFRPEMPEMTAAERYAYKSLPEQLRRRKENIDDTVIRIIEFLELLKEFGEELTALGNAPYSPEGSGTFDPEHVSDREKLLGRQFAGELDALQIFDQIQHQNIRREAGMLGKDFTKKVTALQQLMESFWARFNNTMLPFTRSKAPELSKFETELRQRVNDISYLTRQHVELTASAQDAKAGDLEESNDEIIAEYHRDVMSYVKEYDELREQYTSLSRFAILKRRNIWSKLVARADAINSINKRYEQYDFIDFITFEIAADELEDEPQEVVFDTDVEVDTDVTANMVPAADEDINIDIELEQDLPVTVELEEQSEE